jgi:hypothetical protein
MPKSQLLDLDNKEVGISSEDVLPWLHLRSTRKIDKEIRLDLDLNNDDIGCVHDIRTNLLHLDPI